MNAGSALLGALVSSLWQVCGLAAVFALVRASTKSPHVRYGAALGVLVGQLAWPAITCVRLLQVRQSLGSPPTLETSGQWQWVPVLWVLGTVVMLVRTVGGLVVVRRWVNASETPPPAVVASLEALRLRLGVRAVRWLASARTTVPFTVGFLQPVVLLPLSLLSSVPAGDLELLAREEREYCCDDVVVASLGAAGKRLAVRGPRCDLGRHLHPLVRGSS